MHRSSILLSLTFCIILFGSSACNWSKFSEFEEEAPVVKVTQDGEISSGSFGDSMAGLLPGTGRTGGYLFTAGNASATVGAAVFSASGEANYSQMDKDQVRDRLESPSRIYSLAPAPGELNKGGGTGPFSYMGSIADGIGSVRLIDAATFSSLMTIKPLNDWSPQVTDFGLSVAPASLQKDAQKGDLAIGARGSVILLRSTVGSWPNMDDAKPVIVSTGADWPTGDFTVVTAGDLDPTSKGIDEVVVAAPEKNAVVIIWQIEECFAGLVKEPPEACESYLRITDLPAGARGFGGGLLIADVDGDNQLELVISAIYDGKVFIYEVTKKEPDELKVDLVKTLEVPESKGFGSALAFGKFDGINNMLAVSAPNTEVNGMADAGKLFLFNTKLELVTDKGVALANPQGGELVGRHLAVMPFQTDNDVYQVLVASGGDGIYTFFANLTGSHRDMRDRQ